MGITPQNASEFKQAREALANLPLILQNNPDMFMDEIQRTNPALHDSLLERLSDRWWEQKGRKIYESQQNGGASRTADSSATEDPRIAQLTSQVAALVAERNQEKTVQQQQVITAGFEKSVNDLVAKLPESVPADKRDHIRLKAMEMIWKDRDASARISKGVFIDVPTFFAKASKAVTAETKATADSEHAQRQGVEARGQRPVTPAAENVAGSAAAESQDIWDERGMMRDVEKLAKK